MKTSENFRKRCLQQQIKNSRDSSNPEQRTGAGRGYMYISTPRTVFAFLSRRVITRLIAMGHGSARPKNMLQKSSKSRRKKEKKNLLEMQTWKLMKTVEEIMQIFFFFFFLA